MTLEDRIGLLGDTEATDVLARFARAQPKVDMPPKLEGSALKQLATELSVDAASTAKVSDGDLARSALVLIASDAEHRVGMEAMLNHREREKFAVLETALLVSAVLIALQTHVRYEKDKDGRWTVKIEKKPTDSTILKDLVKKLISFG